MSQLPAVIPREKPRVSGEESSPVVRIQKMIFQEAASMDASDIHIEPRQAATRVRYRVNGVLNESLEVPRWMHENLVVRIKVLAKLDISERRIRQDPMNVVTIEDPIEYEVDGVSQVPVNEKTGLTFSKALRSILRQDPDVVLVGEIRDSDTALTAFHAAMTGHLVMSTLHATDAISALLRLAELGVDRTVLASALIGIVGQRLLRLNCAACAEPDFPRPVYLQHLSIEENRQSRLRQSSGCIQCKSSGSRGRI